MKNNMSKNRQLLKKMSIMTLKKDFPNLRPTVDEIKKVVKALANAIEYKGELKNIINNLNDTFDTTMGEGTYLKKAPYKADWVSKKNIQWYYSKYHLEYLDKKLPPGVVKSIDKSCINILDLLQNPAGNKGSWDRKGMVIGHVQSGKTDNYIGLITKAVDAGYKFIIVIAGTSNELRAQTQRRIDKDFIGVSSADLSDRSTPIGIASGVANYTYPNTLTTINTDFSKDSFMRYSTTSIDISKPTICVIKKNSSILKMLYDYIEKYSEKERERNKKISNLPMLMIDDEVDYASVNTNKEEENPTKINEQIRKILTLFSKSSYVGYTATPFANIFINPDAYSEKAKKDLFPKDFIYSLDAPTNYFSPKKIFLTEETDKESNIQFLRSIDIEEVKKCIPHKIKNSTIKCLPSSLKDALRQFMLVRAIRNLRGDNDKHCSMMINVSTRIIMHQEIKNLVDIYLEKCKQAIVNSQGKQKKNSSKSAHMKDLKDTFEAEFNKCGFSWLDTYGELLEACKSISTFAINTEAKEKLDYDGSDNALTAIVIGGHAISRGLTIEGLCISYIHRNTKMYDTLMQMGRWFGYRTDYEDLCRIHLSDELIRWYIHISEVLEELRDQIKEMYKNGSTPKEFGISIAEHPSILRITASGKMRNAKSIKQNFNGKIGESNSLSAKQGDTDDNISLIQEYWKTGFGQGWGNIELTNKGYFIKDVDYTIIKEFLQKFKVVTSFNERRNTYVMYLEKMMDSKYQSCDVLIISLKPTPIHEVLEINDQLRTSTYKNEGQYWFTNNYRIASRGDEKIGLTKKQIESAEKSAGTKKNVSDFYYRNIRGKPLLMIHSLKLRDKNKEQPKTPAFGISFPHRVNTKGVPTNIAVNIPWVNSQNI